MTGSLLASQSTQPPQPISLPASQPPGWVAEVGGILWRPVVALWWPVVALWWPVVALWGPVGSCKLLLGSCGFLCWPVPRHRARGAVTGVRGAVTGRLLWLPWPLSSCEAPVVALAA